MGQVRNLFISHVNEDDASLQRLKDLLRRNDLDLRDGSIDSSKPNQAKNEQYIKQEILTPRIEWAGCVVVLIGPTTYSSQWVDWEIEVASRLGKRIIGVYDLGAAQDTPPLPPAFESYGAALVGWQADAIIAAIEGEVNDFKTRDGTTERQPMHELPRFTC